jgi:hypothetical protein
MIQRLYAKSQGTLQGQKRQVTERRATITELNNASVSSDVT